MKAKALGISLIILFLISCFPTQVIKESTRYFMKPSLDEIWQASLSALHDMGFKIMEEQEWRGFIYAEKEKSPYSTLRLPAQLNIHIWEEEGMTRVDCEAILVGDKTDYPGERSTLVNEFFKALKKRLKELK